MLHHPLALGRRRVAGTHRRTYSRQHEPALTRQRGNARERHVEVLVNVVAERFQRRDVEHLRRVGQAAVQTRAHEIVEADQERRERLTRPRGRGDQDVLARPDRRPCARLWLGRRATMLRKPIADDGVKGGHSRSISRSSCVTRRSSCLTTASAGPGVLRSTPARLSRSIG